MTTQSLETLAVHAGRGGLTGLGVHAPPIDLSSTYPLGALDEATASLEELAAGARSAASPVYGRLYNPTVARFEEALAEFEGTEDSVAFGSGMAAITASLLAARARRGGSHVVAVRPVYGTTDHLLGSSLLGMTVTWVPVGEVGAAIRPDTAVVVIETPGNPTLGLVDIADVVRQAGDVPVMVDSTFATPVLQRPCSLGAAMTLHSATKFLGGHGDVMAGVVACDNAWAVELRKVRLATGALLHPLGAYLLHRGLPTLPLRVKAAQAGAQHLAHRLAGHPAVQRVLYPGLDACDPQRLIGRQMSGPGTVVSFEVSGGLAAAARVMSAVRLITPAVSLGSTDTLIQHPAGLTHRVVSEEARTAGGITPGLLRLSVGLEDPEDLWRDLAAALDAGMMEAMGTTEEAMLVAV